MTAARHPERHGTDPRLGPACTWPAPAAVQLAIGRLAPREREVLGLMADGMTNSSIAAQLHLSGKTVEWYARRIFEALSIPSGPERNRRVCAVRLYLESRTPASPERPGTSVHPSRRVTCLFSDIEGSTRLLATVGPQRYSTLLAWHERVIRAAVARAGGREVDSRGDEFFVVFRGVAPAAAAAVEIQREFAAAQSSDEPLRVRIAVHTGKATVADGRYLGLCVHRAARICAAGHGGQILLSHAAHRLIEAHLPKGLALRDLGRYRLRDLAGVERLSQLVVTGLADRFPPLRARRAAGPRVQPNGRPAHDPPTARVSAVAAP